MLADLTDGELATLALGGRQSAFTELMRRHREPMYRMIRGYTGDADATLDLVQETFVAAFAALARYDSSRPMRGWLSRIALNKCRDWARRAAVRRIFGAGAEPDLIAQVVDPASPLDQLLADRQELDRLWKAVAALPRQLREPLLLRTVEGLSQAETAEVLRISEKAVETRIYRARLKLAPFRG